MKIDASPIIPEYVSVQLTIRAESRYDIGQLRRVISTLCAHYREKRFPSNHDKNDRIFVECLADQIRTLPESVEVPVKKS